MPNANFFSTVTVDDEETIALSEASYQPGAWVELRADLNVLVILSTAPHPLREGPAYPEGKSRRAYSGPAKCQPPTFVAPPAARTTGASRTPRPGCPSGRRSESMSTLLRQETIRAGDPFMARIDAGQRVRLVDTEGNEAVDTFFFNAEDPRERYSAVDTVCANATSTSRRGRSWFLMRTAPC